MNTNFNRQELQLIDRESRLKEQEEILKNSGIGAESTAFSFDMKYCILSVGSLFHFGEIMRNGCSLCNGRLYINNLSWNRHSMSITLVCGKCNSADSWTSSSKLPDGSFEINRDVVIAWLLSGERIKYEQFTKTLRCGTYSRASWDNTIDLITPIILEAEDDMYCWV